jgi:hypothetical protein
MKKLAASFIVLHGVLHALSMTEPAAEFSSLMSRTLIFGGAASSAVYLVLEFRSRYVRGAAGHST